jgi:hypothetical protein
MAYNESSLALAREIMISFISHWKYNGANDQAIDHSRRYAFHRCPTFPEGVSGIGGRQHADILWRRPGGTVDALASVSRMV